MHAFDFPRTIRCNPLPAVVACVGFAVALVAMVGAAHAVDLVNLAASGGPLVSALTTLGTLTPGVKALVGFLGFVVAFISLAALRNFAASLFYVGLIIFGAVALIVGGAILGAVI
jgi:hypothetical protein